MARRRFLAQLAAWPLAALLPASAVAAIRAAPLKILIKSAWGSDDPTKAAFPFSHGLALAEAGHQVQIYLLGEAVVLMRKSVAEATTPVGWPPVAEALGKMAQQKIRLGATNATTTTIGRHGANTLVLLRVALHRARDDHRDDPHLTADRHIPWQHHGVALA